ncbi:MAG: FtsL-like putative cell division protein [Bacteroidales bacterium]
MNQIRNTIITESEPPVEEPKATKTKKGKLKPAAGTVQGILGGTFMARDKVIKLLPFLMFLTGIGLLYIFNSNYANHTIISISKTKKQIEEQRYEYINTKSKLMQTTRQTEIAKRLINSGLKESKTPPRKIVIEGR